MATYEQREDNKKAARQALREVVRLGETLGHWSIERESISGHEFNKGEMMHATIATPEGLQFSLSGGSWNKEGKIGVSIAYLQEGAHKVSPRDVMQYNESAPDAYISKDKAPAQIVKDIMRRMVQNPAAVEIARKMQARMVALKADSNTLQAHIKAMQAHGFKFDNDGSASSYNVRAWHREFSKCTVNCYGSFDFEASCHVEDVPAILAILQARRAKNEAAAK
jgi:hypothetical protein